MSDSPLVTYRHLTRHCDHPRNHKIDTVTVHCYVGQVTAKQGCDYFATTNREASANYVVGYDGSIGLSVPEGDRSWCSASPSNDNRAVTIEVACERSYPYQVTKEAYDALILLLADICKRNGIPHLIWKNNPSLIGDVRHQNMTVHRWFANTACPGKYLMDRMGKIADAVNYKLGKHQPSKPAPKPKPKKLKLDGIWGKNTTKRLQQRMGIKDDGIIRRQYHGNVDICILSTAIGSGWEFQNSVSDRGSLAIKKLQHIVHTDEDGVLGSGTIEAIQKYLGETVDGIMGKNTVRALQRWLNR